MRRQLILTLILLAACGPLDRFVPDPTAAGGSDAGPTTADQVIPADILFVVDSSASMADEQDALAANIHAFVSEIAGTASYHIGVVSTDLDHDPQVEGWFGVTHGGAPYYGVTSVDAANCRATAVARSCLRPIDGRRYTDSALDTPEQQVAFLNRASRVGTCGSGAEQTFAATLAALEAASGDGCNAGFLRPEANLVLVFLTDEDESEQAPVTDFLSALARYKDLARVRVALVAGTLDGASAACGDVPACGASVCALPEPTEPHLAAAHADACEWCAWFAAPDCCRARGAPRLVEMARALEASVVAADPRVTASLCAGAGDKIACRTESICSDDYHGALVRIARDLVRFQR